MTKFIKALALPILSAGVFGAKSRPAWPGTAAAQTCRGSSNLYSPDTYATPAPGMKSRPAQPPRPAADHQHLRVIEVVTDIPENRGRRSPTGTGSAAPIQVDRSVCALPVYLQ